MTMLDSHLLSPAGLASSVVIVLSSIALYVVGTIVYNLYFSPLRHIPGPWLAASTCIPYALHTRSGTIVQWMQELHAKYGEIVRVAPTELSFISGETAWPDIYGHRTGKYKDTGSYLKDLAWFPAPLNGVYSIIQSNEADHSRIRRNLSHAFSSQALRAQEPLIIGYVDLLINRLLSRAEQGTNVDIMRWYNYTTFDIIADLAFGESLHCLRDSHQHQWVEMVFKSVSSVPVLAIRNKYILFRTLDRVRGLFTDTQARVRMRKEFYQKARERVTERLEKTTDRPDFFSFILKNQDNEKTALTRKEMDTNTVTLLTAGSETTATTLSGATYLLLRNPAVYKRLVTEIRSAFTSNEDITVDAVNKLPYLIAVLQEGLRYYPPVPTGFPRVVPGQGQTLSGHYVPGGTSVYMSQHAANHSPRNYTDPDEFVPERWLEDERPVKYADDKRDVTQPFSFGPRNCLGKNLAYAELRLIMAKILWHFDLELVHPEQDWMKGQKVFALWEKPSLDVKLIPVKRES